ncbi:MAG TPA: DNA polymerase III subunit gamma/tau, partial [Candidatus Saccharimonadales bacterium]|nr:DNA polymerase III subunit gamma/tau [Candidatus Saccharimonadales bacterium]
MGQALYRKYRSKSLDELQGQEHITKTLATAIKSGRIAHAYLFTGPRGVGKTSTARILAYAINGLDYSEGQAHLDIVEIDAASNNSVEDIRDLREKVYVAPSVGKYKVYIIDEVHMLSKAAFNAILKTLEEPPAHAVFILATTEAHKLPETIVSRTQRFVFRPITTEKAVAHLKTIAKAEKIDITDDALQLLAAMGDGSFRDSISLLDQASGLGKTIDVADVQQLLGVPTAENITQLTDALVQLPLHLPTVLPALYALYDQGFQAASIASELSNQLRKRIIDASFVPSQQHLELLAKLLDVPSRADPERYLEIILLGLGEATAQPVQTDVPKPKPVAATPTKMPPFKPSSQAEKKHDRAEPAQEAAPKQPA